MISNSTRSLSHLEAKVVLGLEEEGRHWVEREEIVKILGGNLKRADKVIRSLREKNWIERVAGGRYVLIPAERGPLGIPDANLFLIGKEYVTPYYFGYSTAAAHYRFTTQTRGTVWIATTVKALVAKTFRDTEFRFVSMAKRKFFGYQPTKVFGVEVSMSDPEKTVLDCVDKIDYGGGIGETVRIILGASSKIDWDKLTEYALRMNSIALIQRLGYLAKRANVEIPRNATDKMRSQVTRDSRSYLASIAKWGKKATYDAQWKLLVNVPDREIFSET